MKFKYLYSYISCTVFYTSSLLGTVLDLENAWERVLNASPMVQIASEEMAIWQSEKREAWLLPNPILVVERDIDTSCSLTQIIEPHTKRVNRYDVATKGQAIAFQNREIICRELREEVALLFIDVAISQERIKIAEERSQMAEKILKGSEVRVKIGKKEVLHKHKAQIAFKASELALAKLKASHEKIKKNLSMMWSQPIPDFDSVTYPLFHVSSILPLDNLEKTLKQSPQYLKDAEAVQFALASLSLQRKERIPDLAVTAGYSFHDGFVLNFALPLPIFNQNQENICKASHRFNQAVWQQMETFRELEAIFQEIYQHLQGAYQHLKIIEEHLLPEARTALEMVEHGYQKGKFDHADWLDIQNTVFALREEYLSYLKDYHDSKIKLETLIGTICTN